MKKFLLLLLLPALLLSCKKEDKPYDPRTDRKVMILYSAGFANGTNDISSYLKGDINEVWNNYLPGDGERENILLILSSGKTNTTSEEGPKPVLYRLYKKGGRAVSDTLLTFETNTTAVEASTLTTVLEYAKDAYPSGSYGMVYSSHGTGWVPEGYYANPTDEDEDDEFYFNSEFTSQSIGYENYYDESGEQQTIELNIPEFAEAIPYTLDYIIFDACLMATVEVAFELKDRVSTLVFCPTETMADGFNYETLTARLLGSSTPDVVGVAKDYYAQYTSTSGTITVVDNTKIDAVAAACTSIFANYHDAIDAVDASTVQEYFRFNKHWFYDLRHILTQSGVTSEDITPLDEALDNFILYEAHTSKFLTIKLNNVCGLSMFLPNDGGENLTAYYKTLAWNKATQLVK
ncbi:MAG: hypothetical protein K5984_05385 [Bacteroidales bacterium]|nr:hypothetical protein [Bacteroidales bacterium]